LRVQIEAEIGRRALQFTHASSRRPSPTLLPGTAHRVYQRGSQRGGSTNTRRTRRARRASRGKVASSAAWLRVDQGLMGCGGLCSGRLRESVCAIQRPDGPWPIGHLLSAERWAALAAPFHTLRHDLHLRSTSIFLAHRQSSSIFFFFSHCRDPSSGPV
jgi:hypothetical protein